MKEKNLQPRLLYPARVSFKYEGEIKGLQTIKSWENSAPPNQLSNKCWRIFSRQETQKGCINSNQNNKINGNGIIPINNYLKNKWVECPNEKTKTAWMDTKTRPHICCLQEPQLKTGDTYRMKLKGWKKIFHVNRDQKKAGVAILISDKTDFKQRLWKETKKDTISWSKDQF